MEDKNRFSLFVDITANSGSDELWTQVTDIVATTAKKNIQKQKKPNDKVWVTKETQEAVVERLQARPQHSDKGR